MKNNEFESINIEFFKANGENGITVYAFFNNEGLGEMTACYSRGDDQQMCVYCGHINTEDPGNGPYEEYKSRHDAVESKFGEVFDKVFDIADRLLA